jgi:hypothetical protein
MLQAVDLAATPCRHSLQLQVQEVQEVQEVQVLH